jgi:23S rRNA pseudouridine2605 synthase
MAPEKHHPHGEEVRLQAFLAHSGIASRRHAEELIAAGRVFVNGRSVTAPGTKVTPGVDHIEVEGQPVDVQPITWIALNKPKGYVTTRTDPYGRKTVYDLLPEKFHGLFHVGRLDRDSEGLLLLTNDGTLANRMMHPSFGVTKEYWADVEGKPTAEQMHRIVEEGVEEGGEMLRAESIRRLHQTGENEHRLSIVLQEGKYREVRRMLEALGHPVHRLIRRRFGPVSLGELKPGKWRMVMEAELASLRKKPGKKGQGMGDSGIGGDRAPRRKHDDHAAEEMAVAAKRERKTRPGAKRGSERGKIADSHARAEAERRAHFAAGDNAPRGAKGAGSPRRSKSGDESPRRSAGDGPPRRTTRGDESPRRGGKPGAPHGRRAPQDRGEGRPWDATRSAARPKSGARPGARRAFDEAEEAPMRGPARGRTSPRAGSAESDAPPLRSAFPAPRGRGGRDDAEAPARGRGARGEAPSRGRGGRDESESPSRSRSPGAKTGAPARGRGSRDEAPSRGRSNREAGEAPSRGRGGRDEEETGSRSRGPGRTSGAPSRGRSARGEAEGPSRGGGSRGEAEGPSRGRFDRDDSERPSRGRGGRDEGEAPSRGRSRGGDERPAAKGGRGGGVRPGARRDRDEGDAAPRGRGDRAGGAKGPASRRDAEDEAPRGPSYGRRGTMSEGVQARRDRDEAEARRPQGPRGGGRPSGGRGRAPEGEGPARGGGASGGRRTGRGPASGRGGEDGGRPGRGGASGRGGDGEGAPSRGPRKGGGPRGRR